MARPRKQVSFSSSQATYILERAIADRKVSSADVNRYLRSMHDEISALEERLANLKNAVVEPVKRAVAGIKATVKTRKRKARRKALSAERIASQKIQGQYLGFLRQIPASSRKRYQQLSKAKGRETAIAEMKKKLGK